MSRGLGVDQSVIARDVQNFDTELIHSGHTPAEIGERLGVSQDTVSLITKNFDTELLRSGHTPAEIALRVGIPYLYGFDTHYLVL